MRTTVRMIVVVSVLILLTSAAQAQESTEVQTEATEDSATSDEDNSPAEVEVLASANLIVSEAAIDNSTTDEAIATATASDAESLSDANVVSEAAVEDDSWKYLEPAYSEQSLLPLSGKAMYYNPGVMERVYQNRLDSGRVEPCSECIGWVAMLRSGDLNRKVWIQLPDQRIEGPFLVIDAADVKHVGMLLEREWVIDIDYETARRWRMFNPRYVTVLPEFTSIVDVTLSHKREFSVDIYRSEKMRHNNQTSAYFGDGDELYVK